MAAMTDLDFVTYLQFSSFYFKTILDMKYVFYTLDLYGSDQKCNLEDNMLYVCNMNI